MGIVRAIFFDIGDTLLFDDPPLIERLQAAMNRVGHDITEDTLRPAFRQAEKYALPRYLEGITWDDPEMMRECARQTYEALGLPPWDEAQWAKLSEAFLAVSFTRYLHPKAIPLVRELKQRGFQVGAISDWETDLPDLLTELGLAPYLDAIAVSAIVGATKPNPVLFQDGLRQARVRPEESVHIGDFYELDVAGARAAGMSAFLLDQTGRTPDADCPRYESFETLTAALLALPCPAP